jgi:DNA-binding transcriptional ArsR family regulator
MKGVKPLRPEDAEQLMVLTALDHPLRLRAFHVLRENPDISFNTVARRIGAKTGLAAYHLAVLKASDLVDFRYVRRSRETSLYRLTEFGDRWYARLFGPRRPPMRRTRIGRPRARPKARG